MTGDSAAPTDQTAVAGDDAWLRFSAPVPQQWDRAGRPTVAALSLRQGEDGLSGNLRDAMRALDLEPAVILEGRPGYGLFAVSVEAINEAGCMVIAAPVRPQTRPEDPTHAIVPKPGVDKPTWIAIRQRLLAVAEIIEAPALPA